MNLLNFIKSLKNQGIRLFVEDGQLKIKAAKGALTPDVLEKIKENKQEILKLLSVESISEKSISRVDRTEDNTYPVLSSAQKRLWFINELGDQSSESYNEAMSLLLKGNLSLDALKHALSELIKRHAMLRTVYKKSSDGNPVQVIFDHLDLKIETKKVKNEGEVESIFTSLKAKPFDLTKLPLMRVCLIELDPKKHILIIVQHHIITDGHSFGVLLRELFEFYNSYIEKREPKLIDLPIEYIDYAYWEKEEVKTEAYKSRLQYWHDKLAGYDDLQLPIDKSRPADFSYKGKRINFKLDKKLSDKLKSIAQEKKVTLYTLLLSVFNVFLSRYTAQEDIIVSTIVANRNQKEVQNILGFFVNTLVLRNEVVSDQSFDDFLSKVAADTLNAFEKQDVPFDEVVNVLGVPRDQSRNPISQVMFILQSAGGDLNIDSNELDIFSYSIGEDEVAKFDLMLEMFESGDSVVGSFNYCIDLFHEDTINRMVRNFERLLSAIVENSSAKIKDLRVLTDQRRKQILIDWNDTKAPYPKDKTIYQLFEEQANKTPDNIAVVFENEKLSYSDLNKKSNQLAHLIRAKYKKQNKKDLKPDSLIGLCVERSLDMIIGILGILKAGAAYVPLDPDYPQDRLEYMIEDSHEGLIITQKAIVSKDGFLDKLHHDELLVIDSDEVKVDLAKQSDANLDKVSGPDNLAYVIYTSGSTGKPKGVMVPHQGVINLMSDLSGLLGMDAKSRFLSLTSMNFDIFVLEYTLPLFNGSTCIIVSESSKRDVGLLNDLFNKHQPNFVQATPSMWDMLSDHVPKMKQGLKLLTGGENLSNSLKDKLLNIADDVYNVYGPTETTIWSTYTKCQKDKKVNIGKSFANTQIYILDNNLNPCPIGAPGELYIGGDGVTDGYFGQEELTRERFISNPFAQELGLSKSDRIYKTGDLVRWLPGGNIEYLGRTDFQVKIRGFRIELGEIENVLSKHENILQVSVIDKEKEGQKYLAAFYVIAKDKKAPEIDGLRDHLSEALPDYMVPAAFVKLDEMPLTPNGKINRRALPEPDMSSMGEEYVAPRNEVEKKLAEIWSDILKIDKNKVGIHDNFFHLGGNSLLAIQLVARVHAKLNCDISIKNLFDKPKLMDLSLFIEGQIKEGAGVAYSPIKKTKLLKDGNAMSFAQERLWFLDQFEGSNENYNIPIILKLEGKLNITALKTSINHLIERHASFRTVFAKDKSGVGVQNILDKLELNLVAEKLDNKAKGKDLEKAIKAEINKEIGTPFDFVKGPLVRVRLFDVKQGEHVLVFNHHHIISDGVSVDIILKELSEFYQANIEKREPKLDKLPIQYVDFAAWQRAEFKKPEFQEKLKYWKDTLGDYSDLQLPTDKSRPATFSYKGANFDFSLDKDLSAKLSKLAQDNGTTLYMVLLTAFNVLLSRYSGSEDIILGSPIANRYHHDIEGLVGFFVNTLVLRNQVDSNKSIKELLNQISQDTLSAFDNQEVPFEQIVELLDITRDTSRNPIVQVMFSLQSFGGDASGESALKLKDLDIKPYSDASYDVAKFDLSLFMSDGGDELVGSFNYCTDLFNQETIERIARNFERLLKAIVENSSTKIKDLRLLTDERRKQILIDWNDTAAPYPKDKTIHQLFEEQANKTSNNIAVVFENEKLSYKDLNKKSNQLAHLIRSKYKAQNKKDLKPDSLIGLCVERSLDMIIGILGILKAGGAYVPLDPDYPQDRLEYMIEDSHEGLIITQKDIIAKDGFLDKLHHDELLVIDSDEVKAELLKQSDANLDKISGPDSLAYVIYTSGSTGKPKGTMLEQTSVIDCIFWLQNEYGLTDKDKILQKTPISFDVSVSEYLWSLLFGATLVIAKPDGHKDPEYLAQLIGEHKVTFTHFVPSLLKVLIDLANTDKQIRNNLSSLNKIFCAGEALNIEIVRSCSKSLQVELFNIYGPTESAIFATHYKCQLDVLEKMNLVPIGKGVDNSQVYILDNNLNLCPIGAPGELYIGGAGLARGYLNQEELTKERFILNPFTKELGLSKSDRIYKTGDLVRWLPDGNIEYLGRTDFQVKIRGFRIELGEIENVLAKHEAVSQVTVIDKEKEGQKYLAAFYVVAKDKKEPEIDYLRDHLSISLPDYMVPAAFVKLDEMPLTPNGKINRRALPEPDLSSMGEEYVAASDDIEEKLIQIWQEVLKLDQIGIYDQFFNLGGNSLLTIQLQPKIKDTFNIDLSIADIFQYPTVFAFAEFVRGKLGISKKTKEKQTKKDRRKLGSDQAGSQDIAIIGLACRAPGADNHNEFWDNLENSVESIRDLTDEELLLLNIDQKLLNDANYVKRGGFFNNLEDFDAHFFEYSPLEAKSIDPQQRHFLECAKVALEDAGISADNAIEKIGIYAGQGLMSYYINNIISNQDVINELGFFQTWINNDKDFLTTKASYKLNLNGPSLDVQTGCSTGIVSVNTAINSILSGECDIALAGGVTLNQKSGYLYQEGMIASPDGHCRAFDEKAKGTVGGSAVGVVVLKRLDDALADNDQIYAVIKATAINNDGSAKVGYTAPSVEGQSNVIRDAIEKSGVDPETISYIEAHGTATPLGDPIEISALTQAYRNFTDKKQYVAIGSVKTNIGHTDSAAGVMGLIKTALALKNKKIPASLHFKKPNPEIDFANSPFFVNTELKDWEVPEGVPRRAGVSSFGIGGTNAHAILEEAPEREVSSESRKQQLLLLSAKTDTSVSAYADKLSDFLKENKADIKLADVAYTLQVGRDSLKHRRCYVAESFDQAIDVLGKKAAKAQTGEISQEGVTPEVIFMFSGQGAQYVNMARGLYEQEPLFKEVVDQCCDILKREEKLDLLEVLYPENKADIKAATDKITQTNYAQPSLFVIEYALAKLLMHWGIEPKYMIGHSIGEYIAATIAGVFELKDALLLVATRGKLMHGMHAGSMLSVNLEEAKLKDLLPKDLVFAAVNSPSLSVVSGETKAIKDFQDKLKKKDISCTLLHTSHAFHSPMMQGAADEFLKVVKKVKKDAPKIGFISNLTGDMITKEQAISDQYWVDHLLNAVLFDKGVSKLLTDKLSCLVEIGPGRTLSTFALQNKAKSKSHHVLTSVRHPKDEMDDLAMLLNLVGRLWLTGVEIDYAKFYEQEKRNKISIPTYCFDHKKYWIEPQKQELAQGAQDALLAKNPDITQWFYEPNWEKKRLLLNEDDSSIKKDHVLILGDSLGLSDKIIKSLAKCDYSFIKVLQGDKFAQKDKHNFVINPNNLDDYGKLAEALKKQDIDLKLIIHAWQFTEKFDANLTIENVEADLDIGYYSLLNLMQSLFATGFVDKMSCKVLGNHVSDVLDGELSSPQKGMIQALVQVIPQEYSQVKCQHIDVTGINLDDDAILNNVCDEIKSDSLDRIIAYRGKQRWVKKYTKLELPKQKPKPVLLKDKGVYLITGGLGNVGLLLANYIAKRVKANIILMGRSEFLAEDKWDSYLKEKEADVNDITALKIKRLQEIKALGSDVKIIRADVSDQGEMIEILSKLKQEYGEINGVVHSAGALNKDLFLALNETDKNNCEKHFQPKVQGTLSLSNALNEVLADKPLDFCILMSSLSAVLGGLNFSAYSAVNYFLDHFADLNQASPNNFISIDWDGWLPIEADDSLKNSSGWEYSISSSEGDQLFNYLLTLINSGLHQFVVSTGDLDARIARTDLSGLYDIEQEEALKVEDVSDIKATVSNIWKEVLGVEDIDDDDDFFELGGHSLLAVSLISKLKRIGININLASIIENNTINKIYNNIDIKKDTHMVVPLLINSSKNSKNVFIVHAVGGSVIGYKQFADNLDNSYNYYGIQNINIHGKQLMKSKSLKEMASNYVKEILKIQPEGEYILGGASMGGTIAHEMASQLEKIGKKIKFVFMLDSWSSFSESFKDEGIFKKEMKRQLREYKSNIEKLNCDNEENMSLVEAQWGLMNLLTAYRPCKVRFPIHLYKAKTLNEVHSTNKDRWDNGWQKHTAIKIKVYSITGDHNSMLEGPGFIEICKYLNQKL